MKYSFKCTCGDVMTVDAGSKDEAIAKLKGMMTQDAINQHMSEKHPGGSVLTMDQVHQQIEQGVVEGDMSDQGGQAPADMPPSENPTGAPAA